MPAQKARNIVFIGAGNLATNLALELCDNGYRVLQVYNRTKANGLNLSRKVNATYTDDLANLSAKADLFIVCVSDDVLKKVAKQIRVGKKLIVHTSGSVDMNVLNACSENFGVLYPLLTFSKNRATDFRNVPLFIEANLPKNLKILKKITGSISDVVRVVDSKQRRMYHLAAVFSSNFGNFVNVIARDILEKEGLDFSLLKPIIRKTMANINRKDLFELQTGPAIREDREIMRQHLEYLKKFPDYRKVYQLISDSIIQYKKRWK